MACLETKGHAAVIQASMELGELGAAARRRGDVHQQLWSLGVPVWNHKELCEGQTSAHLQHQKQQRASRSLVHRQATIPRWLQVV